MTTLDEKLGGTATLDVILFQPELELGDYSDIEDDFLMTTYFLMRVAILRILVEFFYIK